MSKLLKCENHEERHAANYRFRDTVSDVPPNLCAEIQQISYISKHEVPFQVADNVAFT